MIAALQNLASSGVNVSFFMAAIVCAAVITLFVIVLILLYFLKQKTEGEFKLRYSLEQLLEVLFASPDGYFSWLYSHDKAKGADNNCKEVCSRRMAVLLGLEDGVDSKFADLLGKIRENDKEPFMKAVDELKNLGKNFALEVHIKGNDKRIIAMGCRSQNYLGAVLADTIWMRDITASSDSMDELYSNNVRIEKKYNFIRQVIDALPFPFWTRDKMFNLSYCNAAYANAVGVSNTDEVVDKSIELASGDVLLKGRNLATKSRKTKTLQEAKEHIVINGDRRYVRLIEQFFEGEEGEFSSSTIGMAIPIDDEAALENKLKGYIGAHDGVLKNLTTAIVIFDDEKRMSFYNQPFVNMMGFDIDWLDTHPTYSEFLDALREKRMLPEERNFAAFKAKELEFFDTLPAPNETLLFLPMEKILRRFMMPYHLGGLLMTYEDITDRMLLESSYKALFEVQRATIDNIHEAIALFDEGGRLDLYNSHYLDLWDFKDTMLNSHPTLAELVEMHKVFFTEDDEEWQYIRQEIISALSEGKRSRLKLERRDNIILDVSRVALAGGGFLVAFDDITGKVREDEQKDRQIKDMSLKDTLISGFISDLDAGFTKPLHEIVTLAAKLPNSNLFVEKANRMEDAFMDLMSFAKAQTMAEQAEPVSFNVNDVMVKVVESIMPRAVAKNVDVSYSCDDESLRTISDKERFTKMLLFIASLSLNLAGKGEKMAISLAQDKSGKKINIVFAPRFLPVSEQTALKEYLGAGVDLVQLCALSLGIELGFIKTGEFASLVLKTPAW